jgi:hypothetical protein
MEQSCAANATALTKVYSELSARLEARAERRGIEAELSRLLELLAAKANAADVDRELARKLDVRTFLQARAGVPLGAPGLSVGGNHPPGGGSPIGSPARDYGRLGGSLYSF